jgi:hypothetical protein
MKTSQTPVLIFLTLLNVIACFFSFIYIVLPNFYFGLNGSDYILFWSIFGILFLLHIIIFFRSKARSFQLFCPLLVVILYLGLLFLANII